MSANTKSVAERAYELWIARGRPDGSALQDWAEAERQLATGTAAPPTPLAAQGPAAKAAKQGKTKKASDAPQQRKRPAKPAGEG